MCDETTLARMCGQFDENDREFFALCEECEEREYFATEQQFLEVLLVTFNMALVLTQKQQLFTDWGFRANLRCMGSTFAAPRCETSLPL